MEKEKKKILLVLSASAISEEAVDFAIKKAKGEGTGLVALYLLETELAKEVFDTFTDIGFIGEVPSARLSESLMREYRQRGYEELSKVEAKARDEGVQCEPILEEGEYVAKVLDCIRRGNIGLVVSTKRREKAFFKYLSKSLADELRERAQCEVVVFEEK